MMIHRQTGMGRRARERKVTEGAVSLGTVLMLVGALALVGVAVWLTVTSFARPIRIEPPASDSKPSASAAQAATNSNTASSARPSEQKLVSRWLRPDGGYVLEIKKTSADGSLEAAYFNPNPINVSQAKWSADGDALRVFVELRDVNYPGATYRLQYYPNTDQLEGVYFQPAVQQSFEVVFQRQPAGQ